MSRLGRAHPAFAYHLIQGAYLTTSTSVGSSDSISGIDTQSVANSVSSSDTASGTETLLILQPVSADIVSLFDTAQVFIGVFDNDVHVISDVESVSPRSSDNASSSETGIAGTAVVGSDTATGAESNSLVIQGPETITALDNSSVGIFSSEAIFSNFSEVQSVQFFGPESIASLEQTFIHSSFSDTDSVSFVDNGSVGYALLSSETITSLEAGNSSATASSSDQGSSSETKQVLSIFLADSISLDDEMSLKVSSVDFSSSSDNLYVVSINAFSADTAIGTDTSVAIVGSDITLLWNIDALIMYRVFSVGKLYSREG